MKFQMQEKAVVALTVALLVAGATAQICTQNFPNCVSSTSSSSSSSAIKDCCFNLTNIYVTQPSCLCSGSSSSGDSFSQLQTYMNYYCNIALHVHCRKQPSASPSQPPPTPRKSPAPPPIATSPSPLSRPRLSPSPASSCSAGFRGTCSGTAALSMSWALNLLATSMGVALSFMACRS